MTLRREPRQHLRAPVPEGDPVEGEDWVAPAGTAAARQRRYSVAHYLSLIAQAPTIVDSASAHREALWSATDHVSDEHSKVSGQWAGLIAKDVWQDALCSIWSEFCRAGLAATYARHGAPLSWGETEALARAMVTGLPALNGATRTDDLVDAIAAGRVALTGALPAPLADADLEELRVATALGTHLAEDPTVADTLWWLVRHFVIRVHERIAYSKLPEDTFRFRWEDGGIRFFNNGVGRFPLAAIRKEPLASITHDLGFWHPVDGAAALTECGATFVTEVFK